MYKIVWSSRYGVEIIDEADTATEADTLAKEYRIAYRNEGAIYVR